MVKIRFHSGEGSYLGCASYDPVLGVFTIGSIKFPNIAWDHLKKLIDEGLVEGEIEDILWEIE